MAFTLSLMKCFKVHLFSLFRTDPFQSRSTFKIGSWMRPESLMHWLKRRRYDSAPSPSTASPERNRRITISNKESGDKVLNSIQFSAHKNINFGQIDYAALTFSNFMVPLFIIHIYLIFCEEEEEDGRRSKMWPTCAFKLAAGFSSRVPLGSGV